MPIRVGAALTNHSTLPSGVDMAKDNPAGSTNLPGQDRTFLRSLSFQVGIGLTLFICLIIVATLFVTHTRGKDVFVKQAERLNEGLGQTITLELRDRLSRAESLTRSLANLGTVLSKQEADFKRVVPQLIANTGMDELVAGGGIWPAPGYFDGQTQRRSFFWGKNQQGALEYFDDYNDPNGNGYHNEEWYVPALHLQEGAVYWSKSYIDPYSLEPMVTCTVPMIENGEIVGVATVDLKLFGLSDFMAERTKVTGGYAFAIDRNNRLISAPKTKAWQAIWSIAKKDDADYPTIEDLSAVRPELKTLLSALGEIKNGDIARHSISEKREINELAQRLADNSYQIEAAEAQVIAAGLKNQKLNSQQSHLIEFPNDPIVDEATSVIIFEMPDIGWKVIVAMPTKYTTESIAYITKEILSVLSFVLLIAAGAFVLFFKSAMISPLSRLSSQVRELVSKEDYSTSLEVKQQNELGDLANWFNVRTEQLAQTLEKVQEQNEALEDARKEAETANESKSMFLASMSHEIRTPMNAIIGLSEMLNRMDLSEKADRYAQTIKSSSQNLLSLINDIMDFSKIEAGKLDLENIAFNLVKELDDCADLIAFQASEKNIDFIYFADPNIPRQVMGDPGRIRQVLLNFTSNAVKFTSDGSVELKVKVVEKNTETVKIDFIVKDTGIGIPEEKKIDLFSPFKQLDSSTTRKFGGTGLGLSISKDLTKLMDGTIRFDSEINRGSEFACTLELEIADAQLNQKPLDTSSKSTCLALINNVEQATAIKPYIDQSGLQYQVVNSVEKWLAALSKIEPDHCVSLIWELSALGDLSLLSQTLPQRQYKHPVIFISSLQQQHNLNLSMISDKIDIEFIALPVKYAKLHKMLESSLGKKSLCTEAVVNSEPKPLSPKPLIEEKAKRNKQRTANEGDLAHHSSKKILVVEDNEVNQDIISYQLDDLGLQADIANDGIEAIEAINKKRYDLVLMDLQMPRMDGLEATKEIRKNHSPEDIKIIAVTANVMAGDMENCLQAGMDDYISKPLKFENLKSKLTRWL